jgi:2-amino-4-hydroxy-6-hydroxymethyldihydropteridine diphosphokinase
VKGQYLLLGTNLGNKKENLYKAISHLKERGISVLRASSIYESEPWGIKEQPWFLNRVLEVSSDLSPEELLETILAIEIDMGRVRKVKWGERLIDIDILYIEDQILNLPQLTVPHPGIYSRRFTLLPLAELEPHGVDPVKQKTVVDLLDECTDPLSCKKMELK